MCGAPEFLWSRPIIENSTAFQKGTDDTKGYSGGSDIVLYEVSTDVTEHAQERSYQLHTNVPVARLVCAHQLKQLHTGVAVGVSR